MRDKLKSLGRSFKYAFGGVLYAINNERNIRIHICMIFYVLFFALIGSVPRADFGRLVICFGLVMGMELLNTGIEKLCDAVTERKDEKIRIAKDAAAGAVLVSAVSAAACGLITFLSPDVFERIISCLCEKIYITVILVATIPLSVWFVLGWKRK